MSGLRLGLRLAVAGGRAGWVRAALIVAGTAFGVLVLLIACAIPAVQAHQRARADRLQPVMAADPPPGQPVLLYGRPSAVSWQGRDLTVARVAAGRGHLRPPGVAALPRPGEVLVSPELRALLATTPALAQLVPGRVVGTIGAAGLVRPDDLRAYVGVAAGTPGLAPVTGFGRRTTPAAAPVAEPGRSGTVALSDGQRLQMAVLVFLGVPVLILLSSAARLSAATRDRRLAALRLLGLTPNRTRAVAAAEAAAHSLTGAALGAGAFWLARPLTDGVRVAGLAWFAADLTPGAAATAAVVLGVPAACLGVSLTPTFTMRHPLALRRSGPARPPRLWRIAPLSVGLVLLASAATRSVPTGAEDQNLLRFLLGTALTGLGLPLALPVAVRGCAALLARGGPTLRLAARRLQLEPATTTRVFAALVTALFLCAGAQAMLVAFERTPQYRIALRAETTGPQYLQLDAPPGVAIDPAMLARQPGVRDVVPVPQAQTGCSPGERLCVTAYVGTCAELRKLMPVVRDCGDRTTA